MAILEELNCLRMTMLRIEEVGDPVVKAASCASGPRGP